MMKPFPKQQAGAILYFVVVVTIALVMMGMSLSRNSITAVQNANLIKLRAMSEAAAHQSIQMVQNFLYEDLKNTKREVQRIIINDLNAEGLYICPDATGNAQAEMVPDTATVTICPGNIPIAGGTDVQVTTLTNFVSCTKVSSSSTEADFNFKTTVEARVYGQRVRQEQFWNLKGFANSDCL